MGSSPVSTLATAGEERGRGGSTSIFRRTGGGGGNEGGRIGKEVLGISIFDYHNLTY
jgi:hypothetical protein